MKIYNKVNVYDNTLERFRFLFDEKPIVVSVSGGKDSTVVFELAYKIAKEKGLLPLKVLFVDQEAEWNETIDQIKLIRAREGVELYWYQMPLRLQNATSFLERWLWCWKEDEKDQWIREKDPKSIQENTYGTDRFHELFHAIMQKDFPGYFGIAGVRTEESPTRFVGLTEQPTYKWITWGKKLRGDQCTLYPIYDWSYSDVWKAIHDNKWDYCKIYDYQYRYGIKIGDMRVSNLHHETAVKSLFYLQEIDPNLYEKLTQRLQGVDMAGKMGFDNYFVKKLPFMFKNWCEYRDFLIEKLVDDEKWKKDLYKYVSDWDTLFKDDLPNKDKSAKQIIQSILANDFGGTKLKNYRVRFVGLYQKDLRRKQKNGEI